MSLLWNDDLSFFYIQESAFVKRPVPFIYRKSRRLKN